MEKPILYSDCDGVLFNTIDVAYEYMKNNGCNMKDRKEIDYFFRKVIDWHKLFKNATMINDSINKLAPVDLCLVGYYNEDNREINLIDFINSDNIIKDNAKDITTVSMQEDQDFTYGKSLGNYY